MKKYVVGLVFDSEMKEILFIKRVKEPFKDCINGVGGKVENGESTLSAMLREVFEETDISVEQINKTSYMFTINFPEGVELNVFYIILKNSYIKKSVIETREGELAWWDIEKDNLLDASLKNVAGDGNIAYFIQYALLKEGK